MKKKLSLVLGTILALSLCLLTACGGDDPAPLGAYDNDDIAVSIVFYEDGTCVISDFDSADEAEFKMDGDELMMLALDAGAEDFSEEEDSFEVLTDPDSFSAVREALEQAGVPMAEADVTMIPQTWVELTDEEDIKKINRILDLLDEDDDVQATYHNWDE